MVTSTDYDSNAAKHNLQPTYLFRYVIAYSYYLSLGLKDIHINKGFDY